MSVELTWEPYSDGDEVGQRAEYDFFEFVILCDPSGPTEVTWTAWVPTYSYADGPGSDEVATGIAPNFGEAQRQCQEWLSTWLAEQAKVEADLLTYEHEADGVSADDPVLVQTDGDGRNG